MSMFTIVTVMVVIIVITGLIKFKQPQKSSEYPFEKQNALFTPAERSFYGVLKLVVGNQYEIFGQVRIADILAVQKGLANGKRQGLFNKINAKHVDFVLCDPNDLSVVAVIELDDKSHNKPRVIETGNFKDEAFHAAGIPLIRYKAQAAYTMDEIAGSLPSSIGFSRTSPVVNTKPVLPDPLRTTLILEEESGSNAEEEAVAEVSDATEVMEVQPQHLEATIALNVKPQPETESDEPEEKSCPKCSSDMVHKTATKGIHQGEEFWVCPAYPKCKTIISLEAES